MCLSLILAVTLTGRPVAIPAHAEPSTRLAATELTNYLFRITGVASPLIRLPAASPVGAFLRNAPDPAVVIGTIKTLGDSAPAAAREALAKTDDIEAAWTGTDGDRIWIVGKNEVAELYATYHFLESKLGVRWFQAWTKEDPGDYVPEVRSKNEEGGSGKSEALAVKPFAEFREPRFKIRMMDACRSFGCLPATNAATCAVRNGFQVNAPYATRIPYEDPSSPNARFYVPRVPHKLVNLGGDHSTFFHTCPPGKGFREHPEWFALAGGKRVDGQQYCISNPELRDATAARIIRMLDRDGGDGQFVFGMWDTTYGWCECDACRALDDPAARREITPNVSRRFMLTVKCISEKIYAKHPKADLRMWAYHTYRRRAKDVTLDRRIKICFCDHSRCYGHALDDPHCPRNAAIYAMMRDWADSGHEVYVYAYLLCTDPLYTCNEAMQADDLRKYAQLGIMGWKEEAVFSDSRFVNLKDPKLPDLQPSNWQWCYATAHLLWNPDLDLNALLEDAESKYYGAAYPAMRKYHALRRKLWNNNPACMGYPYGDPRRPTLLDVPLAKERLLALLDKADRLADGQTVLRHRLARDRRWLETYWIKPNEKLRRERATPAFAAARADGPVTADGRLAEAVWMKTGYADFGGTSVGAAFAGGQLAFSITGPEAEPSFCLYPPNIDNRRYRFTVGADGAVACEVEPGGRVAGAYGAKAAVRRMPQGTVCEVTVPTDGLHPLRAGEMWQVMFGKAADGFDWRGGTGYASLTIGAPYPVNGNFAELNAKGLPKDWVFADGTASVEKGANGNVLLLTGRMFRTMAAGELRQGTKDDKRIRFSFRAAGKGRVRVAFYRYTDVADTSSNESLRKHSYRRLSHAPHGEGGRFALSPEMRTYSGEYTIAAGEWCAIAFCCEGASEPVRFADISVTRLDN